MYNLESLNPFSREAVACTVAFERMGFDLEQVGAGVDPNGVAFVTLHHGGEQYNVVLGNLIDIAPDVYVGRWREAVRSIGEKEVDDIKLAELCHMSGVWGKMETVVANLMEKGFLNVG